MDYVTWRGTADEYELFADECGEKNPIPVISCEQNQPLIAFLKRKENPHCDTPAAILRASKKGKNKGLFRETLLQKIRLIVVVIFD